MKNTYQRANRTHNSSTRDWWFFRHGRVYYFSLQVLLDSMISAVFHRSVQRESGNVVLLWTSPSSRLPDDVGRFHPSNPLFQPTRYKPSFLAHIKTYAFRYPNIYQKITRSMFRTTDAHLFLGGELIVSARPRFATPRPGKES